MDAETTGGHMSNEALTFGQRSEHSWRWRSILIWPKALLVSWRQPVESITAAFVHRKYGKKKFAWQTMLVLLRKHFLLTRMRNVSSAAVMSTHAWDGEIFGKPRDLLNLDALQRSGWMGPGSVRWNAFKNCSVSVQAIKVTLCSCGENWARHLFRRSESAVGFTSFSVWERGSVFKMQR